MPVIDELVKANEAFAASHARLHPEKFLGLEIGDAHVIRNAGGRAEGG